MHWEQSERVRRTLGKLVWPAGYGISTLNAWVSPQITAKERTKQECSPPLSSLVISRLRSVSRKMPPSQRTHPYTRWYYF